MRSEHRNFRDDGLGQSCANPQCLRTKKAASSGRTRTSSAAEHPTPHPSSIAEPADRIVLNIDTPDTNWQFNAWEKNSQDQRSLALVRLLPGEAKRAAPKTQLLQ